MIVPTIFVHIHYCTQFSPPGCEHADVLVVVIWAQSILGGLVAAWKGLFRSSFFFIYIFFNLRDKQKNQIYWSIKSCLRQKWTGSYPRQKNIPKVYDVKSPIKWVGFAVGSKVHEDGRTPWEGYFYEDFPRLSHSIATFSSLSHVLRKKDHRR